MLHVSDNPIHGDVVLKVNWESGVHGYDVATPLRDSEAVTRVVEKSVDSRNSQHLVKHFQSVYDFRVTEIDQ